MPIAYNGTEKVPTVYRATANYDMGYALYCENELPVILLTLKLVLLGGRALQFFILEGLPLLVAPPTSPQK